MASTPPSIAAAFLFLSALAAPGAAQIATTSADFEQPGTQPGDLSNPILPSSNCTQCHSNYAEDQEPFARWIGGMMANAMRDPVFHAALTIANQDLEESGELCLRCHTPGGWLTGNSTPADGSALTGDDFDGVTCNVCHRIVDPITDAENPAEDAGILAALAEAPETSHSGQYVIDPFDRRRGPFDLGINFPWHEFRESPHHRESLLCANCHDVSNPAFTRNGGAVPSASDSYDLNTLATDHPTDDAIDMFPNERTFTEWALSDFAAGPIEMGGRFGGNITAVSTCQDCHMPKISGEGCSFNPPLRPDLPQHDLAGANSWVPRAIYSLDQSLELYDIEYANGQELEVFEAAIARNVAMLEAASDLSLSKVGNDVVVRITNQTGHKLPTGYAEGRRMWINVQFYAPSGALLLEHGAYDASTATLTTGDTKVYEAVFGLDANMATTTGLPEAPSFHFALNNKIYKDNRIPPRGFDNAAFEAGQAHPVGATYANGQYWDDTSYAIPAGSRWAIVSVYHQTTSKEYIEFLRDENTTDGKGDIAYDEWVAAGKSAPVLMDRKVIATTRPYLRRRAAF